MLKHDFQQIQTFMKQLNCQIACVSVISFGAIIGAKRAIEKYAMKLNQLAKMYQDAGLILAFHHHDCEFRHLDGKPRLAWLIDLTDPTVKFVLDTYWLTKMKEDPLVWMDRLKDRLVGLHLRDHAWNDNHRSINTELGQGTIDFAKIIGHVATTTAIYGAIEQNTRTPYQSVLKSVEHLHQLGIDGGKEEI
jgi:sugar phosphate isomerase/epimerase